MASYKVRVVDAEGRLIVGATLNCVDDTAARIKFETLPLPPGHAELSTGARVLLRRTQADGPPARAAG